jgi:5-methylcytosine-specific restriction protein A
VRRTTPHLCSFPGCPNVIEGAGRCPDHQRKNWKRDGPSAPEYGTRRWRNLRDAYIAEHPRCERCGKQAQQVHHRDHCEPGTPTFWQWSNLESVCLSCHRRETGTHGARRKAKARAKR